MVFSFLFVRNPLFPLIFVLFSSALILSHRLLLGIEGVNRSLAACTAAARQKNPTDYVNGKNGYLESLCQRCSVSSPTISAR